MRTGVWGARRGAAVLAIVVAIAVAAPELAAPAGAAGMRSSNRTEMQARPGARAVLLAKRRRRKVHKKGLRPISAAKKRTLLTRYIKSHPRVLAAHARRPSVTLAKKLKLAAYLRLHPKKRIKRPAVHRKPVRHPKKATKKKKKKASAGASWHRPAELLVGLSVGLMALFLIGSSVFSGPRSRARARARRRHRSLVPR